MRKYFRLFVLPVLAFLGLSMFSCDDSNTYADYVEAEDDAISSFIKTNSISVTGSMPEGSGTWKDGTKDLYYLYSSGKADGLYYHQVELGDGDEIPDTNWTAYVRYIGYSLSGEMIYNCTATYSPDPQSFIILSDAYGAIFARGFQQAVRNLRVGGHCKVIIPFSLGNGTNSTISGSSRSDADNYQPMFYEIWLVGLE